MTKPIPRARADHIHHRRRRVAQLRVRGQTYLQIVESLERVGIVNPDTGKPYTVLTVKRDVRAIRDMWEKEAKKDIGQHIAATLAELDEIRRVAWSQQDLETVLKAIKQKRDLLGLDTPKELVLNFHVQDTARRFAENMGLDVDEVMLEAERILAEA